MLLNLLSYINTKELLSAHDFLLKVILTNVSNPTSDY